MKSKPAVGMRVKFVGDHPYTKAGRVGRIDCISEDDSDRFCVSFPDGGYFGWTNITEWEEVPDDVDNQASAGDNHAGD